MLIPLTDLIGKHRFFPNGVLHLGAHTGEEAEAYVKCGVKNVVWVEADPDVIPKLQMHIAKFSQGCKHHVVKACVADKAGKPVTFRVTNNRQSSSILPMGTHLEQHPEVHVTHTLPLSTTTVEKIFSEQKFDPAQYDFLNADLQGSELLALKGMGKLLAGFKYLYLEVNKEQLYQGCALLGEIDKYVEQFGFKRVDLSMTTHGWGDAFYIKR